MNNQKLFQETFSKVTLSEKKRKELVDMGKNHKKIKRKIHVTKAAAASVALGFLILAGGSAAYAIDDGKIFNSLGHWLKCTVTVNGEKEDAQISEQEDGSFIVRYGTETNGGEFEIDKNRDTTCMDLNLDYETEDGQKYSSSYLLKIDETLSRENQLWQIRSQMLPMRTSGNFKAETSRNFITALRQAAAEMSGIWKEGLFLAASDIKQMNAGRKIAIEDYDFEDGRLSWILIDYTDVETDEHGNAEFTQMSTGGYITKFRITLENNEICSYEPVEK